MTALKCPNCNEDAVKRAEGEPTWANGTLVACTDLEGCGCGHAAVDCDCRLHVGLESEEQKEDKRDD
ncbi:hypothetical protein LCGC14_1356660 [marine sediment metagenome]|uniref:Uncharacterized protein n=1 Tax=marine sediment metagenome TaxID=412755 RepID=A0A0F9NBL5_9ZZZZ